MSQLDNVIITDIEVIQKTEEEWSKDNPVVGLGYGAYSIDTHLMRKGDGSSKWSELESFYPSTYVGPHAHTHEVGGNDEIKLTNGQLPHTANGTVVFGTGTGTTDIPLSGFTLTEAYVCENEIEVNQIKEIASNSKIYNISTNEVEEQQADGSWKVNPNTSIYEEIKSGRFAYNTYTNKLFYIQDGKVLSLTNNTDGNAPIGSTYVQFSGCSDPTTLFGGTWSNISSTYPGMFFRAEGGSAATFGSNQNGGLPNIEGSTEQVAYTQMCSSAGALSITQIGNCSVSGSNHTFNRISINASLYNSLYGAANEVRPINSTIRIWIRTA